MENGIYLTWNESITDMTNGNVSHPKSSQWEEKNKSRFPKK